MSVQFHAAFSNNAAQTFVGLLAENPTWDVARDAFQMVIRYPDGIEYDDGAYVLAAAALITSKQVGAPALPPPYLGLVATLGEVPAAIQRLAVQAFPIAIVEQKKLAERWLEPGDRAKWGAAMDELQEALARLEAGL